jgi:hypothetical protein
MPSRRVETSIWPRAAKFNLLEQMNANAIARSDGTGWPRTSDVSGFRGPTLKRTTTPDQHRIQGGAPRGEHCIWQFKIA